MMNAVEIIILSYGGCLPPNPHVKMQKIHETTCMLDYAIALIEEMSSFPKEKSIFGF